MSAIKAQAAANQKAAERDDKEIAKLTAEQLRRLAGG